MFLKEFLTVLNDVMTVSEVAEYLRVNPQTVYRKAKVGELPAVRIGRAIRFRRTELEKWMKSSTAERLLRPPLVDSQ